MALNHTHTLYDNFVLANEIEDQFNSMLDLARFVKVDRSLVGTAGDTVKIVLTSDSSVNAYGFKADVVAVYAECQHLNSEWSVDKEPLIGVVGHKSKYCNDCGRIVSEADIMCLSYGDTNRDGTVNALDMAELRNCMLSDTAMDDSFDANGDSVIDARDLVRLKKVLAGITDEFSIMNIDVSYDGYVTSLDLTTFRKYLLGKIKVFK